MGINAYRIIKFSMSSLFSVANNIKLIAAYSNEFWQRIVY